MNIHLGCWTRNIPGWINVDLCDLPHIHQKTSIDDHSKAYFPHMDKENGKLLSLNIEAIKNG